MLVESVSEKAKRNGRTNDFVKPAWKKIVKNLQDDGFESEYLDRLTAKVPSLGEHQGLEQEIMREMAQALSRAANKVNFRLLELDVLAAKITDEKYGPARTKQLRRTYEQKRENARRARWELKVHREALGFIQNDELEEIYPIPPKLEKDSD